MTETAADEAPRVPSGQLALSTVIAISHAAGFACSEPLLTAVAIAVAESSLHPDIGNPHPEYGARSRGSAHEDRGLWQISSYWWPEFSDSEATNPVRAAEIAFELSEEGSDFTPWDTYDNGAAQSHFDRAYDGWPALRPVVERWCTR
jgi:hypothetical protein